MILFSCPLGKSRYERRRPCVCSNNNYLDDKHLESIAPGGWLLLRVHSPPFMCTGLTSERNTMTARIEFNRIQGCLSAGQTTRRRQSQIPHQIVIRCPRTAKQFSQFTESHADAYHVRLDIVIRMIIILSVPIMTCLASKPFSAGRQYTISIPSLSN